jgi:serine/threonine-protein kinase HipA
MLAGGDDRAGALAFGETAGAPTPGQGHHAVVRLPDLLRAAEKLDARGPTTPDTKRAAELLLQGVSLGGARPKAVVADQGTLWLAKFPGRDDRFDMAAIEAGLLTLAQTCGMTVPEHRTVMVGGRRVLLVRRFDRAGPLTTLTRSRYLSALTLLDADEQPSTLWSYTRLAQELRRRSIHPDEDRRELFRRMAFNALISNGDDHPRNHAIIAWSSDDWHLSPLFDVVPTAREGTRERRLALVAGQYGRAAVRANLVSMATVFRVDPDEAHVIIDGMQDIMRRTWEDTCRGFGATAADLDAVRHAIVPEGFEDDAPRPVPS